MCVSVALVIHNSKRMRIVILSSVACPALQYFSTLPEKRHDFPGKMLLNICHSTSQVYGLGHRIGLRMAH
jgi:hypothetical protein